MCGAAYTSALLAVLASPDARAPDTTDSDAHLLEATEQGITLWRPEVVLDGSLLVVEVAAEGCEPSLKWGGHRFETYPVGLHRQALLPVGLGVRGDRPLQVTCGDREAAFAIPVSEGTYPESKLSVDPRFTRKPPRRVVSERAAIKAALAVRTAGRLWAGAFLRPAGGVETSPFGVRRTFNGKLDSRHRGLDLDGKVGDDVTAANDGVVVLAAPDFYYTGNAVFIDHGDELFSMYFHLSRLDVKSGDRVERGQVIGAVGNTGRVTGPHLHFAVKLAGVYVDPKGLFAYQPDLLLSQASAVQEAVVR
ncbi:MAG: M23 family metallopeptidase [Deltaproteobacteria bacterium]|nr:M23 family metallopeptidase [Deltaproteobacteria bacterium]